jgi:hypothetical protein
MNAREARATALDFLSGDPAENEFWRTWQDAIVSAAAEGKMSCTVVVPNSERYGAQLRQAWAAMERDGYCLILSRHSYGDSHFGLFIRWDEAC